MDIQLYNGQFQKVVNIIESAKECACAYRKENEELWRIYQQQSKMVYTSGFMCHFFCVALILQIYLSNILI